MRRTISRISSNGVYEPAAPEEGDEQRIEDILYWQQAPGDGGTDKSFWEGRFNGHDTTDKQKSLDYQLAKKAGISTAGKLYMSSLADRRGPRDPEAWVSGISDVKAVVKKRNYTCEGIVNHVGVELPPPKKVPLSEHIINRVIKRECEANPSLKNKPRQELREMAIAKHGKKK